VTRVSAVRVGLRVVPLGVALAISGAVYAQVPGGRASAASAEAVFARAKQLVMSGSGAAGRLLVDSVLAATSPETPEYAEALFWRASLASTTAEAERDYRRIVVDYPFSPRSADALLQLAQLETTRGDRENAAAHLERFLLENPTHAEHGRAGLTLSRLLFERRELAKACTILGRTRGSVPGDAVELRNQLDYLAPRCSGVDTGVVAAPDSNAARAVAADTSRRAAATPGVELRARYAVEIGTYATRAAARTALAKLAGRGIDGRIDGRIKPFRVRVGQFETRMAAADRLRQLRAKGFAGTVIYISDEP